MSYVKIDCRILTSSLWSAIPDRDVFITTLLMARPHTVSAATPQLEVRSLKETGWVVPPGEYGLVDASGPGILRQACVSQKAGLSALERLGAPDPESKSMEFEGRRLVRVQGGYLVLNYMRYRDKDHSTERVREFRARNASQRAALKRDETPFQPFQKRHATPETPLETQADADADAEANTNTPLPPQPSTAVPQQTSDDTRGGDVVSSEEPKAGKAEEFTGVISGSFSSSSSSSSSSAGAAVAQVQATLALNVPQAVPQPPKPQEPPKPSRKEVEREFFRQADAVYAEYPKKAGRFDALKAITKLLREGTATFDHLLAKTKEYAAAVSRWDPEAAAQYTPLPATWYNGHRFNDDPRTWERRFSSPKAHPVHRSIALKAKISRHKANTSSVYHSPSEVTPELEQELRDLKLKLLEAEAEIAGIRSQHSSP